MKIFCNENYSGLNVQPLLSWHDTPTDNAEIFTLAFSVDTEKKNEELSFSFSYNGATRKHQMK